MDCMRNGFESGRLLDGRFEAISPLNHGSFGMVFTARDLVTGDDVAIKCVTKPDAVNDTTCPAAIATDERSEELLVHAKLGSHPNVVSLIHQFETQAHQYMVFELCGSGDLYEAIRVGRGPLETEHVREFLLELVDAIDFLHSKGVFHRDIKPENIFLTSYGQTKLGDFGLSTMETWSTEFAVGSDRYMAPEQFESSVYGFGYSPAAADIWAIGIVLLNVLFQRNPFTSPTIKDPLFADFARNRQSLWDVFPNMSEDTYAVLRHSLALDPADRSLAAVRQAVKAAVTFTIDDEALDDFCTEQNDLTTTAGREPLRTPSITSPNMNGDSFPWSTALLKTPQKPVRQLSTIHDEPDLFPGSVQSEWQYIDADEASLASNVDSGLGLSYKSAKSVKSTRSSPSFKSASNFVGSLPISFNKPINKAASPYGASYSGFSKSWSDLWDEEEELAKQGRSSFDLEADAMDIDRVETVQPRTPQLNIIAEDERGSITPRPILAETDPNTRSASPLRKLVENDKANPETPKQRASSIMEKWAALGKFRRSKPDVPKDDDSSAAATPTPQKHKFDAFASFTFSSNKKQKSQPTSRDRAASWRQASPQRLRSTSVDKNQVWERKDHSPTHPPEAWQLDNNWREHKPPAVAKLPQPSPPLARTHAMHNTRKNFFDLEDDPDMEWVIGGWRYFDINT